jgi:DNA-binding GntR family transcriptional regulator
MIEHPKNGLLSGLTDEARMTQTNAAAAGGKMLHSVEAPSAPHEAEAAKVPTDMQASRPAMANLTAEKPTNLVDGRKNTMATQLADRLREAIVSGQLEAGSKINLSRARTTFDVSLSPLREALARLIADGLVEFEDNRGYRVAPVSLSNLEEVTRLREEFEILALREAMRAGTPDWERDVMRAVHRLNRTVRDASQPQTLELWERYHRDFHLKLISGCKMPVLLSFCSILLYLNDRYRRTFLRATSGDRNVNTEHSEIAQGAVARDFEYACDRLHEHIHRTGKNLHSYLSGKIPP